MPIILGVVVPKVVVDLRESRFVVEALRKMDARVVEKMISPGDYVVGEGFAIERKTFRDFIQSIYKKRLFEQIERLRLAYPRCCLVIEGDIGYGLTSLYNPQIFWGALAKATADWDIPIIFTVKEEQTAQFIFSLAKKLQEEEGEAVAVRYKPKFYTRATRQRFAVQGLPKVGPKLADRLLKKFRSVRRVFTATRYELLRVDGFGKKRAEEISRFLDETYPTENEK
jgi:DNA excision repair protein ERCC-4